ncbi:galactose-1-phosphate uridyl transferase [Lithohypha guttulata]|uniref:galactose-1-phosphate uridyl transferase n=1 Tax=Lithohypha guttulata TaxID=1690604 RepID=UPI002DE1532F|nr:galactose-1-phosphate uridyl transferase [Lithohypha guttulata]
MPNEILNEISHRRYNPLRDTWVLVSPHRTKRPWQGQQESPGVIDLPQYDEKCYLCPKNKRASGDSNPDYTDCYAFVNDFSAVKEVQDDQDYKPDGAGPAGIEAELLQAKPERGKCYVLTFSRRHDLTLADMSAEEIRKVVKMWTDIYTSHLSPKSPLAGLRRTIFTPPQSPSNDGKAQPEQYRHMQIFENKGAAMGCSNPHPHGQIWTQTNVPEEPGSELLNLIKYKKEKGRHMLVDYAALEIMKEERVVYQNNSFLVLCPWWATWPFEVMLLPKRHIRALVDLDDTEQAELASCIAEITRRYDNLFETSFPYSMGIHQAPLEGPEDEIESSSLHVHFYPPLLRSATVRKFLVGYEMLAEPQRDITPEQAASRLRDCGGELYRKKLKSTEAKQVEVSPSGFKATSQPAS